MGEAQPKKIGKRKKDLVLRNEEGRSLAHRENRISSGP